MSATPAHQGIAQTDRPSRTRRFAGYAIAVTVVLFAYSYPALHTRSVTKSERLPVISAPDLALYLSLSSLESPRSGVVLNPYYRVEVPEQQAGYLKFRLSPALFGWLTRLMSGRMWWSLFVWNAFWWALGCAAALWLFDRFLPVASLEFVLAGLAMLMFFNFGTMKEEIVAWVRFPELSNFAGIGLPYIRSFSPQVVLPVLLVYLGLQMLALRKENSWAWAVMVILQLFACATFPYATLMMAGTTAIAALCHMLLGKEESAWRSILLYGIACAIVDSIFVFHGTPAFTDRSVSAAPLIHFQSAVLRAQMGRLWAFMGILCAAVALSRTLAPEIRWTLLGLGITNMLMLLGDALVPGPPFFLTNHASYFEHATIVILLTFLGSALAIKLSGHPRKLRLVMGLAVGFFCVNGVLLAESGFRRSLPANREQADMVDWFEHGEVGPDDLVIAQHDACGWVPFLTNSQVLFCRNAQAMLTPQQNHVLQRVREGWYLYFMGKGSSWVESVSRDPNNVHRLETYGRYGEVSSYLGPERTRQVDHIRNELTPILLQIETHDPGASGFLRQFKHIWIIDNSSSPIFVTARLGEYVAVRSQESSGGLMVMAAIPK